MLPPVPPARGSSHTSLGKPAQPRSAPALSSHSSTPAVPRAEAVLLSLLCQQTPPCAWQLLVSLQALIGSSCWRPQDAQDHGASYTWMGRHWALQRDASASWEGILPKFPLFFIKVGNWKSRAGCAGSREPLGRAWGPIVPLRGNELMSTGDRRCQVINCN